jgi:hypothetical protein
MAWSEHFERRRLLLNLTCGLPVLALAARSMDALAADPGPLLSPDAQEAKAVKYVEDATKAQRPVKDSTCANCGLYQGKNGAPAGACQIFPGKQVKAAAWCSSWAPQI